MVSVECGSSGERARWLAGLADLLHRGVLAVIERALLLNSGCGSHLAWFEWCFCPPLALCLHAIPCLGPRVLFLIALVPACDVGLCWLAGLRTCSTEVAVSSLTQLCVATRLCVATPVS
jgi:hypothetical protein